MGKDYTKIVVNYPEAVLVVIFGNKTPRPALYVRRPENLDIKAVKGEIDNVIISGAGVLIYNGAVVIITNFNTQQLEVYPFNRISKDLFIEKFKKYFSQNMAGDREILKQFKLGWGEQNYSHRPADVPEYISTLLAEVWNTINDMINKALAS